MTTTALAPVYRGDPLASLDEACRLLASSRDLDEVRHIRDLAEAARLYAKVIRRGLDAQNYAAEIKLRAERRAGELLAEMPKNLGGPVRLQSATAQPTYEDLGIEKTQAHRWQQVADVPPAHFEEYIADTRAAGAEITTAGALRAARHAEPPPVPPARKPTDGEAYPPLLRACTPNMPTATIVAAILRVAFPDAHSALDLTYGLGSFWDGSAHVEVIATDLDPERAPHGSVDFRNTGLRDASADVALFDPPHVADGGADGVMAQRYGTYTAAELEDAIRRGAAEAWRVARLGVVIKVTDGVHSSRYVKESDWVRESVPGPLYDEVYQTRATAMVDPKWGEQLSAYNNMSTYLIFRKDGPMHVRRSG